MPSTKLPLSLQLTSRMKAGPPAGAAGASPTLTRSLGRMRTRTWVSFSCSRRKARMATSRIMNPSRTNALHSGAAVLAGDEHVGAREEVFFRIARLHQDDHIGCTADA